MNFAVLTICCLNLAITIFLLFKAGLFRRSIQDLKVVYFSEVSEANGFIKKQKKIQIKAQLLIGEIPVGHAFLISEQISESVDEAKLQAIIEEIAKPLARLGIAVVSKGAIS